MKLIFINKFKRQAELGEVGSRDIMQLVEIVTSDCVLKKFDTVIVERFDKVDDADFDLMTEVRVGLAAFSTDLTLADRRFTYINKRAKDFGCMNIQIKRGDIL